MSVFLTCVDGDERARVAPDEDDGDDRLLALFSEETDEDGLTELRASLDRTKAKLRLRTHELQAMQRRVVDMRIRNSKNLCFCVVNFDYSDHIVSAQHDH
jgi:hypothetical protein